MYTKIGLQQVFSLSLSLCLFSSPASSMHLLGLFSLLLFFLALSFAAEEGMFGRTLRDGRIPGEGELRGFGDRGPRRRRRRRIFGL